MGKICSQSDQSYLQKNLQQTYLKEKYKKFPMWDKEDNKDVTFSM